jgi:adenylate cyclase
LPPIYRDISILFADIVGFTALSERLNPVQIARLLNGLFEEMLQEVFAVDGTLDKYIGDCIMAFFGAPEPHVDHADRALKAALGMLERLDRLNASGVLGEPLQLRIAINSGRAIIGDVGSSQRVDYTALGATINLAARMESTCQPGECVISEATYQRITQSQELFQPFGEHHFKGIERPITLYQTDRGEAKFT